MMKHKLFILALFLIPGLQSCGLDNIGNTAYTNKIQAPAMVSKLYGTSTQTFNLSYDADAHISWMGIMQGNDYSYFKITKVEAGSTVVVEDGVDDYTASSSTVLEDINISASTSQTTDFEDGTINVAGTGNLKITVQYSPLQGIDAEETPHEAYLLVYYDKPEEGAVRIELRGFTQGIESEKCAQAASSMEAVTYSFKNDSFDLYVCGSEVKKAGMANATDHGTSTNLAQVPMDTGSVMTIYKADEETLCLIASSSSNDTPTIPDFRLPVPQLPGVPVESLGITMMEGSFAECTLDADGNFFCDNNIQLEAENGAVPLSNLTATNETFLAEETTAPDCSDFGSVSGSGTFASGEELTLVVKGEVLSGTNSDAYNITGAGIIGVITLEP